MALPYLINIKLKEPHQFDDDTINEKTYIEIDAGKSQGNKKMIISGILSEIVDDTTIVILSDTEIDKEFYNIRCKYKSNNYMDERTRLKISYDLVSTTRKLKLMAKPCVKRYLNSHVRSKFLEIPSNEWDIALFLPLERFTVNKNTVFRNSTDQIRKR